MTHVRYSSQLREADMNGMPQLSILFGLCLTACDMTSCYANGPVDASREQTGRLWRPREFSEVPGRNRVDR